jgi:hypothetical protein
MGSSPKGYCTCATILFFDVVRSGSPSLADNVSTQSEISVNQQVLESFTVRGKISRGLSTLSRECHPHRVPSTQIVSYWSHSNGLFRGIA